MPCKRKTVVLEEFENYVLHIKAHIIAGTYINDSKRLETFIMISPLSITVYLRACLYERRDGTFTGTRRLSSRIYMNILQAGQ